MLEKRIDGWWSLTLFVLVPVGVYVFLVAVLIGELFYPALLIFLIPALFVVLLLRDSLVALIKGGLPLDVFHWAAICAAILAVLAGSLASRPLFSMTADGNLAPYSNRLLQVVVIVTLILAALGAVRSRYNGKTRSLDRFAGGFLVAMTVASLDDIQMPDLISMEALLLLFLIVVFGEHVYKRLPRKKQPTIG